MRAVKSIILAAGSLKRKNPDEEESRLTLRAISDCNIPKFLSDDIPLFEGIISDLFPTTDKSKPQYEALVNSLKKIMQIHKLQSSPEFDLKSI
jgi:dynein heavy chain